MRVPSAARPPRRGATIVEAALVLPIVLLFLFGVIEYGRYLLVLQVSTNAARDGARWAVVRAANPDATAVYPSGPMDETAYSVFTGPFVPGEPAYTGPVYAVPFIKQVVVNRMGGLDKTVSQFDVRVFPADTAKLYANPCVIDSKPATTSWANAAFTERIAVKIVGRYRPILPQFLFMTDRAATGIDKDSFPFSVLVLMGSEG